MNTELGEMQGLAGCEIEGGGTGRASTVSFYQPCAGISVEDDNTHVTDSCHIRKSLNGRKRRPGTQKLTPG